MVQAFRIEMRSNCSNLHCKRIVVGIFVCGVLHALGNGLGFRAPEVLSNESQSHVGSC